VVRRLPAGVLDAGFSSLATFLSGLFATRYLSSTGLGAYALCCSAFIFAGVVPAQLVLVPAEVASIALESRFRTTILRRSLRLGGAVGGLAAMAVQLVFLVPSHADPTTRVMLAVTASAVTMVSPLQDHVRRMLHQAGRSWQAAKVSMTQAAVVVSVLIGSRLSGLPAACAPFGALAAANILSGSLGLWLALRTVRGAPTVPLAFGTLARSGGWLLVARLVLFGAQFGAVAILATAAGDVAVGRAEAARILAQPATVLVIGLLAVFNPTLMSAAQRADTRRLARSAGVFFAIVAVATAGWLVLAGVRWPWSPLAQLFPRSYEVPGLLPWTIAEQASGYATLLFGTVLMAARREKVAFVTAVTQSLALLAFVTAAANDSGPFALAWGDAAGVAVVYVFDLVVLWRMFGPARRAGTPAGRPAVCAAAGAGPAPESLSGGRARTPDRWENP
jgi:hypothetical protein